MFAWQRRPRGTALHAAHVDANTAHTTEPAHGRVQAPILDDTMLSYLRLRYSGAINVMIVYNAKGDQRKEERALRRKWHRFTRGNISVTVVANNTCALALLFCCCRAMRHRASGQCLLTVYVMTAPPYPPLLWMVQRYCEPNSCYEPAACAFRDDGLLARHSLQLVQRPHAGQCIKQSNPM